MSTKTKCLCVELWTLSNVSLLSGIVFEVSTLFENSLMFKSIYWIIMLVFHV